LKSSEIEESYGSKNNKDGYYYYEFYEGESGVGFFGGERLRSFLCGLHEEGLLGIVRLL
jgi:hypothetical protein